jgi:Flp pilus assembly protein TadD
MRFSKNNIQIQSSKIISKVNNILKYEARKRSFVSWLTPDPSNMISMRLLASAKNRNLYPQHLANCFPMPKEPLNEDASGTWLKEGIEFLRSGRHSEAVESFDRHVLLNPNDADVWNLRGLALAAQNRFADALESFGKAVSIDQRHPDAWYNQGMVLCALERYEEAVWSFEKALEINPQNAHAWHNKGVALSRLGLDAEAKFAFSCAGWIGVHSGL